MTLDGIDPYGALVSLGMAAAGPLERVTGGWDTALWRFTTGDGARHALRVFRSEESEPSARAERCALAAAARAGLPVPRVEAAGAWEGRPAAVLSWCDGVQLISHMQRRPWSIWRLGVEFGAVQAAIHAVPAPRELREVPVDGWLNRAEIDAGVLERVHAAGVARDALIHLDYHPINVLTDGRRITAVLDWATAAAGDRRADVARTSALLEAGPIPPGVLKPVAIIGRRLFSRAWRRGYERGAGTPGDLAAFQVWAGETFVRDLEERIGESHVWAAERDVEEARRWTARWRARSH